MQKTLFNRVRVEWHVRPMKLFVELLPKPRFCIVWRNFAEGTDPQWICYSKSFETLAEARAKAKDLIFSNLWDPSELVMVSVKTTRDDVVWQMQGSYEIVIHEGVRSPSKRTVC